MTRIPAPSLEDALARLIRVAGLPEPTREARFIEGRRFRADFMWPDHKLLLEVDGGQWVGGRHVRPQGFARDCEKASLAAIAGWRVLHVTAEHIHDGKAIEWITQALEVEA